MGVAYWDLRIELPEPEGGAVYQLAALLGTRAGMSGRTGGRTTMSVPYATAVAAGAALGLVRSDCPDARCYIAAVPAAVGS